MVYKRSPPFSLFSIEYESMRPSLQISAGQAGVCVCEDLPLYIQPCICSSICLCSLQVTGLLLILIGSPTHKSSKVDAFLS